MKNDAERKAYEQGQEDGYSKGWTAGNEHEDALDAEIAKLKAERDARIKRLEHGYDELRTVCNRLKAERDAAYVRGLELAKALLDSFVDRHGAVIAIQAEIDKAKAVP